MKHFNEAGATLDLANPTAEQLEAAVQHYAREGFLLLDNAQEAVSRPLEDAVADALGFGPREMAGVLDSEGPPWRFPLEIRERLSRVATSNEVAQTIARGLAPLLRRLLGPMVHVSSTFHAQFKASNAINFAVDHGGYLEQHQHMELHGAYLLHQDFAGASIPTSPHAVTLWVGLNDCPDWTLRLFPKSHRLGLICQRWLAPDDPRLDALEPPIDIPAQRGRAVMFHAMLVHGSGRAGRQRRVSCDIRLFPLCGFLPTQPLFLEPQPLTALLEGQVRDPLLKLARREARMFLGLDDLPREKGVERLEPWLGVIASLLEGDTARAKGHLARMVHPQLSTGTADEYASRLLSRLPDGPMLARLLERLGDREPANDTLAAMREGLRRLQAVPPANGAAHASR